MREVRARAASGRVSPPSRPGPTVTGRRAGRRYREWVSNHKGLLGERRSRDPLPREGRGSRIPRDPRSQSTRGASPHPTLQREGRGRESLARGTLHTPPHPPSGQAPQKKGERPRGGGTGRPASEEDEAQGGLVWGAEGREEPEGRCLRWLL